MIPRNPIVSAPFTRLANPRETTGCIYRYAEEETHGFGDSVLRRYTAEKKVALIFPDGEMRLWKLITWSATSLYYKLTYKLVYTKSFIECGHRITELFSLNEIEIGWKLNTEMRQRVSIFEEN